MRFIKLFFLLILLFGIPVYFSVKAQSLERIDSFDSQIQVSLNGQLHIIETIDYVFPDQRHGIFRTIPLSSRVDSLYRNISINFNSVTRDGTSEPYQVSRSGVIEEIKIGDPNQTISGEHVYKIAYTVDNQIGNYQDHDEIYWNVTGNNWQIPIQKVSATVTSDSGVKVTNAICYTGVSGSTAKDCESQIAETTATYKTISPLQPKEGLSVVTAFPLNTFPKSKLSENQGPSFDTKSLIILGILGIFYYLVLPVSIFFWYRKNHHKNRFGPVTVNFDIPEDEEGNRIPPAEAGAVDNAKVEKNDVVATIFDLAIRKYLKLVDVPKDQKFLGIKMDSTSHQIQKLRSVDDSGLNKYEKMIMSALFKKDQTVDIQDFPAGYNFPFELFQDQVFNSLVARKLYLDNPTSRKNLLMSAAFLALILGGNLPLAGILFYLFKVLNGKTDSGEKMDWQLDGLKLFLKNMSREYRWQAQNLITVEKYIPYAIALGYIDEFMKQLKLVYPNYRPGWYSGSGNFNSFYPIFASSLNSGFATAPAASSGFSGGGFSGGGGGGGGGGSW